MKRLAITTVAALATATGAFAGGIERTNQSVGVLFEDGEYLEWGFSFGVPDVSGVGGPGNPTAGAETGDIADSFGTLGFAYKGDINESLSYALIYDQPYGADVTYPLSTYVLATSNATFESGAVTGVLQYNMGNGASVYGGLRGQAISANASIPAIGGYTVESEKSHAFGYLVGAAYERPEIALRVALTYLSEIEHDVDVVEFGALPSEIEVTTPQAVNLEFQSGVAEDTLVFGSVRWVEWSEFLINPPQWDAVSTTGPLVFYDDDRITYTLGAGRRLNENWSVLGAVSYEESTGSITGNLGPTDGFTSVGLGAIYSKDNMKVTGGVRYVDIGDASTTINGQFSGSSAVGFSLKVGWTM